MNKNALMFNLHVENKNSMHYYSMLYYALETLEKFYDETFDVIVHYKTKNFEFEKEFHLGVYNIYRQFLFPIYIESTYPDQDGWMSKWYALQKTFELGYEKVFMIDNDIIFYGNPSYMFEKYGNKNVAHVGADGGYGKILERVGIASGNEIIHRKAIHSLDTLFERALEHRKKLIQKSEDLMTNGQISETIHKNFKFFSEQYAGNFAIQDPYDPNNIPEEKEFVGIKPEDLVTPANCNLEIGGRDNPYYCVNIIDNKIQITDVKTTIIHYSAAHASVMLPNRLFTDHLLNGYNEWVTKIPNIIRKLKKLNG